VTVNAILRSRLLFVVACAIAATVVAGRPASAPAADVAPPDLIARGEYLTHGAGQCFDCHGADLHGAPMHVPPGSGLATLAPAIAGLPMFKTDAAAITFLTTAVLPDGTRARGPMPAYMFHTDDAVAIVAYLRSLK
jgi:mono/diheme cytochrome c family protein